MMLKLAFLAIAAGKVPIGSAMLTLVGSAAVRDDRVEITADGQVVADKVADRVDSEVTKLDAQIQLLEGLLAEKKAQRISLKATSEQVSKANTEEKPPKGEEYCDQYCSPCGSVSLCGHCPNCQYGKTPQQ